MELVDIDKSSEEMFFHCLHPDVQIDKRILDLRYRWHENNKRNGLRAKVLKNDHNKITGLCQYIPIEQSHLNGNDLLVILCIDYHGSVLENRRYRRYMLECIEKDAKESKSNGVVAWGMDFPYWNPISNFEDMGYVRIDKAVISSVLRDDNSTQYDNDDIYVLAWKPFSSKAVPPKFIPFNYKPEKMQNKINLTVFVNSWCSSGCFNCMAARDSIKGLENEINYIEIDTSDRDNIKKYGIDYALIIDDDHYTKYLPPMDSNNLRQELLKKIKNKII